MSILWELFISFLQIGLFSIGGGMAAIPLIQNQIVNHHGWLTLSEFTDLITIAEMTPGPIAVNSATFIGLKISGLPGALTATFGCILPSIFIVSLLAWVYKNYKDLSIIQGALAGLRPIIIALIASAGLSILILSLWREQFAWSQLLSIDWVALILFSGAFIALAKYNTSPIKVMLSTGFIGGIIYLLL